MPGQYSTAEEFERIVLRANPDGSLVRLRDVARVELGVQSYSTTASFQEHPACLLLINQSPGSNAVEVGRQVNSLMKDLAKSFPDGVQYNTVVDSTHTIVLGIQDIVTTLLLALLLVVLVIYLFLQNIRATIVPLIARDRAGSRRRHRSRRSRPGEYRKRHERPGRHDRGDEDRRFADHRDDVGVDGRIPAGRTDAGRSRETLRTIRHHDRHQRLPVGDQRFFRWFNRRFASGVDGYLKTSGVIVRHSARTLLFIGISAAAVVILMKQIPTGFLPDEDQGYLITNIQLPNAASLTRTEAVIKQINDVLDKNDNVQSVTSAAGFSLLAGTGTNAR